MLIQLGRLGRKGKVKKLLTEVESNVIEWNIEIVTEIEEVHISHVLKMNRKID